MRSNSRTVLVALCFLLPNFLGFLVFTLGPVVFSLGASFTNWNLTRTVPFRFVWLDNYLSLIQDPQFWIFFINTLYFMLGIPFAIVGALFLAVLLSQKLRGMTVYRTLLYLPSFTAGVALFILWKQLYNPEFGPINTAIRYGLDFLGATNTGLPQWLLSTQNLLCLTPDRVRIAVSEFGLGAREAIIIMGIWIAIGGNNMLLYIAGISNIPEELYEAADVDGANAWQKFWNVTWPQLAPTTFFIVIMSCIGGLQGGFEQARIMSVGGAGGPAGTTTTLAFHIYNKAFVEFQVGYASAIAWVLFAIIFAITMVNWRFGSRHVND